ncbi:TRAFAC clade GTPase domain-containing protein [Thermomonospora umbrina]|uniref:TRAFAC clade GTPase domain-containing protein n=1 Tax=Thermomonospora umbrina TaxID=111806 RepID=UPI0011C140A9|nr:hypothetical protein [Thermomonospora umbrina]
MLAAIGAILVVLFFIAIPFITIAGLGFAGYGITLYTVGVAGALDIAGARAPAPVAPPPSERDEKRDPAWPHYLYGPAWNDLKQSMRMGFRLPIERFTGHARRLAWLCFEAAPALIGWPSGLLIFVGLGLGAVGATAAVLMVALFQTAIWLLLALLAFLLLMTLRGADTLRLKIKGIGLFCPACHQKVDYPSYDCPHCGRRHADVRPGRYGVVNRRCYCGLHMRTLLMLGSSAMVARCPSCGERMAEKVGTAPEFVLPVVGGASSGKTRLMLALVLSLDEREETMVAFADEPSKTSYDRFVPALKVGADTWKTVMSGETPLRGYSIYVSAGETTKLLHVFDPAGEVFESAERIQMQRYLAAARTFVYTLDQLAVEPVWRSLEVPERARFKKIRSTKAPELMFAQVLSGIEEQGVDPRHARLAVALTKQDLVSDHVPAGDSDAIRAWLESPEVGLDNMVRTMTRAFAEIRFFRTSSRIEDGLDPAINDLTDWILGGEGFRL